MSASLELLFSRWTLVYRQTPPNSCKPLWKLTILKHDDRSPQLSTLRPGTSSDDRLPEFLTPLSSFRKLPLLRSHSRTTTAKSSVDFFFSVIHEVSARRPTVSACYTSAKAKGTSDKSMRRLRDVPRGKALGPAAMTTEACCQDRRENGRKLRERLVSQKRATKVAEVGHDDDQANIKDTRNPMKTPVVFFRHTLAAPAAETAKVVFSIPRIGG